MFMTRRARIDTALGAFQVRRTVELTFLFFVITWLAFHLDSVRQCYTGNARIFPRTRDWDTMVYQRRYAAMNNRAPQRTMRNNGLPRV